MTGEKACDFLARGVEAILNGMPAVPTYAMVDGIAHVGAERSKLAIAERLMADMNWNLLNT